MFIKEIIKKCIHNKYDPVIIYSMGKVGSQTVYSSLKNSNIKNQFYHVHFLSRKGIQDAKKYYRDSNKIIPDHISQGEELALKIKNPSEKIRFITLVREPVARDISDYFHNAHMFSSEIMDSSGQIVEEKIYKFIKNEIEKFDSKHDYTSNWFDNELKEAIDINVYDFPFDHDSGYRIIKNSMYELLVIRCEDLNKILNRSLKIFLGVKNSIGINTINTAKDKSYAGIYKSIKTRIKIRKEILEKIYSTRYVKNFYTEKEIMKFINVWGI